MATNNEAFAELERGVRAALDDFARTAAERVYT